MVRRKKTTVFIDAKETTSVRELKRILQGILKVEPENQRLSNETGLDVFADEKSLADYNLTGAVGTCTKPCNCRIVL
ncbi:Transcription elongation factor B polypeptide 2 [Armadillidium nasatum]|uniref:Transcription elongation factor B polypeptide 2 n=1 Tax=Armadillidium nasatum TaxID=96803 RepID=A0A5N5SJB4_9CRUS|nr:Transcription elongation factor B polypeptide 2 [Armadillidium nasatum]